MDRRYRMELQLVRVPVVWKAKVPEKKLFPATRKVPFRRHLEKLSRLSAEMFMARLFDGVPDIFKMRWMPMEKLKQIEVPPWEDE